MIKLFEFFTNTDCTKENRWERDESERDKDEWERDKEEWEAAKSFEELCVLGGRYIKDDFSYFPCWGRSEEPNNLSSESFPITPYLLTLNSHGFLTTLSQPHVLESDQRQKAYVRGLMTFTQYYHLENILRQCHDSDVKLLSNERTTTKCIAVTTDDFYKDFFLGDDEDSDSEDESNVVSSLYISADRTYLNSIVGKSSIADDLIEVIILQDQWEPKDPSESFWEYLTQCVVEAHQLANSVIRQRP